MKKTTEIHSNVSKEEAYKLMEQGYEICHEYYSDDECLKIRDGVIYDENDYRMGTKHDEFWSKRQIWKTGWMTTNAR